MDKPRFVCDLCFFGKSGKFCLKGGVDRCLKEGRYVHFRPRTDFASFTWQNCSTCSPDGLDDCRKCWAKVFYKKEKALDWLQKPAETEGTE